MFSMKQIKLLYQSLNKEYIDTFKALKEMNNINSQNSSFQRRDIN